MRMIRVGVIGVGAMGQHHARVYSAMNGVKFVGVSDLDEKRSKDIASKYNIDSYSDYRVLLGNVDAVSIAVPTSFHEGVALDAIENGCHVLIEKPISNTLESAKRMIVAANDRNVKLMVGHIERFNPVVAAVKSVIENQKLLFIEITRVGPFPPRVKDVGVVSDIGIHDIDLITYITDSRFEKVLSLTSSNGTDYEDTALLSFRMENGILAHITTNWLTPYKLREIMVATKTMVLKGDLISQKLTEYKKINDSDAYSVKDIRVVYEEPLKLELKAFISAICNDTRPVVDGSDGLYALEIAMKCTSQFC